MWYLLWFVGILLMCSLSTLVLVWLDPRSEKLTNVGLMQGALASHQAINNVRYEKRKHIDESDLNPIFISSDSVNPAICIRSE